MAVAALAGPFGDQPIEEVPLPSSPLAQVLAQVRFPRLSALVSDDAVANTFVTVLRDDYPLLNEQQEMAVVIGPGGVTQTPTADRTWQLRSADEKWRVSFGAVFLTIDTAAYVSRSDFSERLRSVWARFVDTVAPPFTERVGVRYINRITDADVLDILPNLVRPEAVGGLAVPLDGATLRHSLSESLFTMGLLAGLQVRAGVLPPGATLDPTLSPVATSSWVLDLDAYRIDKGDVDPVQVGSQVEELAERAYRYFRWVTRPAFLTQFGGDPT